MMRFIVDASLRYRFIVVFLSVVLLFFGAIVLPRMPVDVFPEFAPPLVEIQAESWGANTEEIEELITIQLEQALYGTPGLAVLRSKSVPGLCQIKLIFAVGMDLMLARQLVSERLAIGIRALPPSLSIAPHMLPPLSATSRAMKIGVSSKDYSVMELSMITYWTIRWKMMQVPGVANVAMWGERLKQLQVQADPELLRAYDVPLYEVMQVTSSALETGLLHNERSAKARTGGFIDTPNQRLMVRHEPASTDVENTPQELAKMAVNARLKNDGTALRLGDLGPVVWGTWPLIGDAVINDGPGLLLVVEKFPWGNSLEVSRGVEAAIEALKPGLPGIDIDSTIFRPASFVELSIENLTRALLFGCLLVILVLIAFLFEWRTAFISFVAIPISLVAAGVVLYFRGTTINTMILAGLVIAVGVVVDDAIIDIENILRRLRQARREGSDRSVPSIILDASLEVRGAIVYATLIILLALVPVFFLEGLSGSFFQPLASSYALAVGASLVVALTVTPALSLILLPGAPLERRAIPPLVAWLQRGYDWVLNRTIHRPRLAYATVIAIVLAGVAVWPFLKSELLPEFKERDFLMHWLANPGSSAGETTRIVTQASKELRQIPGVRNFGAHIGRAIAADEPYGIYFAENWISVDPKVDYDATLARIQETVDGYPGLVRDVQTYLKERIREVLTGASDAIVVRISGPDTRVLRAKSEEVKNALSGIEGVADLKVEVHVEIPHIQVKVDLARAQEYGIKPGDVQRQAGTFLAGLEVSDIHREGKVYGVHVWTPPEARDNLTNIREMVLDTPRGGQVRLQDVADVDILPTENSISRENLSRKQDVQMNVKGRDLGSVAGDVERALLRVEFPLEYNAKVLGEFAERQASQGRLLASGLAAVVAIFFVLLTSFGSWRMSLLTFVTLPWALVGGLLAAYFFSHGTLSLGSLVGLLTVLGIATRNGIMMISHYQHLEDVEGEPFGPELVVRGARERLAPILMTALATGLALVPLAIAGSIPGHEIEHPMAIVILGGLITSVVLNLLVVPSMYLRFGRRRAAAPGAAMA